MLKLSLLPFYLILLLFKLFWGLISAFVRLMGKMMWFCCGIFLVLIGLAWVL